MKSGAFSLQKVWQGVVLSGECPGTLLAWPKHGTLNF